MDTHQDTILIVDDSSTNIQILGGALMQHYEILVATSGREALGVTKYPNRPDLILLDVLMPGMDGYEVCRRLKENSWTRDIPIIFITAKSGEADERLGLELGAVDYIAKPFSMPIVMARIKTHLELKRHRDMLERLSYRDGLTGVPNRRHFDQHIDRLWRLSKREQKPMSILMVDIDNFKSYNDTYGHLAGDDCLRKVAQAMYKHMRRPVDLLARYGGEEFVIILSFTVEKGAAQVAEKIRKSIAALEIEHKMSSPLPVVTISIGGATAPPEFSEKLELLIDSADRALYSAKEAGRNTSRIWDFQTNSVVDGSEY